MQSELIHELDEAAKRGLAQFPDKITFCLEYRAAREIERLTKTRVIKTAEQRLEELPDMTVVTHAHIVQAMQDEIDELRGLPARLTSAKW
jgi:hypothetical protein